MLTYNKIKEDDEMKQSNMVNQSTQISKLELLRKTKGIQREEVNIEKAIDGLAESMDSQIVVAEIEKGSAIVNLMIDCSLSMQGTSSAIAQGMNIFAKRQAKKIYTTKLSLRLFNDSVYTKVSKINVGQFAPISPWDCTEGTNIYDAIFLGITSIVTTDASHKLHLIITDGENGKSRNTLEQVSSLISSRVNRGEHVFLLYNNIYQRMDVKDYANMLKINPNRAVEFNRNGDGIKIIFQTIEDLLESLRSEGTIPEDWAKAITMHAADPIGVKARETKYLG